MIFLNTAYKFLWLDGLLKPKDELKCKLPNQLLKQPCLLDAWFPIEMDKYKPTPQGGKEKGKENDNGNG